MRTGRAGALTLSVSPGAAFPLAFAGLPAGFYTISPGIGVGAEYLLGFAPGVFARAGIGYRLAPLTAGPCLSLIEATIGVGDRFGLLPWLSLKPYVAGGYHFGFLRWTPRPRRAAHGRPARASTPSSTSSRRSASSSARRRSIDGGAFLGIQASVGASYSFGAAPATRTPGGEAGEDEAGEARARGDAEGRAEAHDSGGWADAYGLVRSSVSRLLRVVRHQPARHADPAERREGCDNRYHR